VGGDGGVGSEADDGDAEPDPAFVSGAAATSAEPEPAVADEAGSFLAHESSVNTNEHIRVLCMED
jgi:hypothetical protein